MISSEKARNATATAKSPSVNLRSATAKSLLIDETGTKTETKTEGAAVLNLCNTDATVKIALAAV